MRSGAADAAERIVRVSGVVDTSGSITVGNGQFTITKGATGIYTLRLFGLRAIRSVVTTLDGGAGTATPGTFVQPGTVQINVYNATGVATDYFWSFVAEGIAR